MGTAGGVQGNYRWRRREVGGRWSDLNHEFDTRHKEWRQTAAGQQEREEPPSGLILVEEEEQLAIWVAEGQRIAREWKAKQAQPRSHCAGVIK